MTQRLTYPAPYRHHTPSGNGGWSTEPWDADSVAEAILGGAWFSSIPGAHDFARGGREAATNCQEVYSFLRGD